jgi:hypothetical protein
MWHILIIIIPISIILLGLIYSIKIIKKYWINKNNFLTDYTSNNQYFTNLEQKIKYNNMISNKITLLNAGKIGFGVIIISIGLFFTAYLYELGYYQFIFDWINAVLMSAHGGSRSVSVTFLRRLIPARDLRDLGVRYQA